MVRQKTQHRAGKEILLEREEIVTNGLNDQQAQVNKPAKERAVIHTFQINLIYHIYILISSNTTIIIPSTNLLSPILTFATEKYNLQNAMFFNYNKNRIIKLRLQNI